MSDSYPALIELISRLEGKDKKTCELALYCLNRSDKREKKLFYENEKLREALRPFAIDIGEEYHDDDWFDDFKAKDHRAAAAALKETGDA